MVFRLGRGNTTKVVGPINHALTKIAQARVDSTVARAVARHENALAVDGFDIYLWQRGNGGLICTCRQPAKILEATEFEDDSPEGLRMPKLDSEQIPPASPKSGFKIVHNKANYHSGQDKSGIVPTDFKGLNEYNDPSALDNTEKSDPLDALAPLNTADNIAQIATLLSDGAGIYGGDKTPCGICFGTGRTHGYQLATGKRIVLDASNEYIFTLQAGAQIKPNSFPAVFSINTNQHVEWSVTLPAYTNGWLSFSIRNNLKAADNLQIEWFYNNAWELLTLTNLAASEGTDRKNVRIRVSTVDKSSFDTTYFTHVELIYATTKPLIAQCPPLSFATNFELVEPIINTEFEVIARVSDIPRESVFQDSKFKYLWKVTDVSPKMTSAGQVFSLIINARMIHRSEMLYALRVLFDPQVNVHFRGLEIIEGGLERDEIGYDGSDDIVISSVRTS